jgi:predicted nucleotidyltransferase component of viral defense system
MKPTKATLTLREIARLEAGSNLKLQPVIEKELIHYEIIRAMSENGFLERLCFQGGTALRLCYGSDRFSEDLDFTGGVHFDHTKMDQLKQCIEDHLSNKYGVLVEVKSPQEKKSTGIKVSSWQVKVITSPGRPDIPMQIIKIEVANVPTYTRELVQISENYQWVSRPPLIIGVESMDEIMADKLLALPAAEHPIRYRDIWDLHWLAMNRAHLNLIFLNQKINDYGVEDFQRKLNTRILSLTNIIHGSEFMHQMTRFLTHETIAATIAKEDYRAMLIGSLTRLLSSAIDPQ